MKLTIFCTFFAIAFFACVPAKHPQTCREIAREQREECRRQAYQYLNDEARKLVFSECMRVHSADLCVD